MDGFFCEAAGAGTSKARTRNRKQCKGARAFIAFYLSQRRIGGKAVDEIGPSLTESAATSHTRSQLGHWDKARFVLFDRTEVQRPTDTQHQTEQQNTSALSIARFKSGPSAPGNRGRLVWAWAASLSWLITNFARYYISQALGSFEAHRTAAIACLNAGVV